MKEKIDETGFSIPYKNILYIIIGFGVMVLGYILMLGGGVIIQMSLIRLCLVL
jgi:hypothetical protein